MQKELEWIKIAGSINEIAFGANGIAEIIAEGKTLCIGLWKDELFAFASKCPHAGGAFAAGYIDALGNVVCPLHRYKFCLKNGRNVSGEGYYLKRWPVTVSTDGVFAGFEKGLFNLLS